MRRPPAAGFFGLGEEAEEDRFWATMNFLLWLICAGACARLRAREPAL
jgi:hypothetical protein